MIPAIDRLHELRNAALDSAPVSLGHRRTNSPHEFYRYPARFTPRFARAAIDAFSNPGDLVLDPFVGGGTTAVEALVSNRPSIVSDLNTLATFVTRVKTTPLDFDERLAVQSWVSNLRATLNLRLPSPDFLVWQSEGYMKDIEGPETWRLRKLVALALASLPQEPNVAQFCRCVILRTAQWALDMRRSLPSIDEFRTVMQSNGYAMLETLTKFYDGIDGPRPIVIDAGLPGLSDAIQGVTQQTPKLVLTSPPYPGVYVNYHRWKMLGRKELRAPYWITNQKDGHGLSHYTMNARHKRTLDPYFAHLHSAFHDLSGMLTPDTLIVQIVGFSDPSTQLPRYLGAIETAGLEEVHFEELATDEDRRLWRSVPGRRWWTQAASNKEVAPNTSREVVLFHRLGATP